MTEKWHFELKKRKQKGFLAASFYKSSFLREDSSQLLLLFHLFLSTNGFLFSIFMDFFPFFLIKFLYQSLTHTHTHTSKDCLLLYFWSRFSTATQFYFYSGCSVFYKKTNTRRMRGKLIACVFYNWKIWHNTRFVNGDDGVALAAELRSIQKKGRIYLQRMKQENLLILLLFLFLLLLFLLLFNIWVIIAADQENASVSKASQVVVVPNQTHHHHYHHEQQ